VFAPLGALSDFSSAEIAVYWLLFSALLKIRPVSLYPFLARGLGMPPATLPLRHHPQAFNINI